MTDSLCRRQDAAADAMPSASEWGQRNPPPQVEITNEITIRETITRVISQIWM
jgi:hypothetical protein